MMREMKKRLLPDLALALMPVGLGLGTGSQALEA
jgi:hypothetical protein